MAIDEDLMKSLSIFETEIQQLENNVKNIYPQKDKHPKETNEDYQRRLQSMMGDILLLRNPSVDTGVAFWTYKMTGLATDPFKDKADKSAEQLLSERSKAKFDEIMEKLRG